MAAIKTDICIIGTNLEALATAKLFQQAGFSVSLLERTDRIGGTLAPTVTAFGRLSKQLPFWPATDSSELAARFVSRALGKELSLSRETLPPLTFQKNQFQTFVGFGENAPDYADEIAYYLHEDQLCGIPSASELIAEVATDFTGSIVYSVAPQSFKIENDVVQSLELDDGRSVEAKAFVFCEDPRELLKLIDTEEYTQRELQKVHRTPLWTVVSLDLIHNHVVTKQKNVHLLTGTTKESLPCVGMFELPQEINGKMVQSSHWISFIASDIQDEEALAHTLREMKRQIKRAYPEALNDLGFEKIMLCPENHGKLPLKADAQGRWPGLSNLWMTSSHLSPSKNLVGSMCQSALVYEGLLSTFSNEKIANPVAVSHL